MRGPVVAASERVTLRRWDRSDAKALFEICRHEEVARMYGSRPRSVREVRTLIADFNGREEGLGVTTWAVALRASGALIGWCGYARTNKGWLSANVVEIGVAARLRSMGTGARDGGCTRRAHDRRSPIGTNPDRVDVPRGQRPE